MWIVGLVFKDFDFIPTAIELCPNQTPSQSYIYSYQFYDIFESQAWIQLKSASSNPFSQQLSAIEEHCTARMAGIIVIFCLLSSFGIVVPFFYLFTHSSLINYLVPLSRSHKLCPFFVLFYLPPTPSPQTEVSFPTQAGPLSRNYSLGRMPLPKHDP